MAVDCERWLTFHGRRAPVVDKPAGLRERLQHVATVLAEAGDLKPGAHLLWRNRREEVNVFAVGAAVVVGRAADCDLSFADPKMSRRHCRLPPEGGELWLEDLNSTNGTCVNGRPITRVLLCDGDLIQVGGHVLVAVMRNR